MAKLCLKKPSKRQPARRRYKIEKKIREHNRKKRKETKKLEGKTPKKLVHIPNICPFKETILKAAEEYKQHKEKERQEARERARAEKTAKNLQELVDNAEEQQIKQAKAEDNEKLLRKKIGDVKSNTYYREFQKVVAAADVILEVVDARDPLGTRCPTVEQLVRDAGDNKRLVLVLNKSDLVPYDILDKWLKYLRQSVPAIPFKSSTQLQGKRLGRRKMKKGEKFSSGGVCMGAEGLTSLLANYTRNKGVKTALRVGVVGLPNVGKSSLINSLKRSRACKVGAVPGVTRSLQEVSLDSKIKLLDSPGLAFASSEDPSAALKNSIVVVDAGEAAELIVQRAGVKQLHELYLVPEFKTTNEFLVSLAKRFGKFGKGAVPDTQAAAQILLMDWNRGKISYYTQPPEISSNEISCNIITNSVAEFDLESYDKQIKVEHSQEAPMEINDEDKDEETATEDGKFVVTGETIKKKRAKKKAKKEETIREIEGSLKMKKVNKLNQKKMRKVKKKNEKREQQLSKTLQEISL